LQYLTGEKNMKTKAAVLYEYRKPLVVEELDLESPKAGEVLVEYKVAGICHSDLSIVNGIITMPPLPCIPGHEGAGMVVEVGAGVTRVKPGDHVLAIWVPSCGQCYYCVRHQPYLCVQRDRARTGVMVDGTSRLKKGTQSIPYMMGVGTFSKYNVLNEKSVLPMDKDISFEAAAVTGCAVVTGVGAVFNAAKVQPGSSVAVVGIGGVGLNVIQGAFLANATTIIAIDLLDNKLELARQFGATHTVNPNRENFQEKVNSITGGIGVDYSFEVIGTPKTAQMAFDIIRRGGTAVMVGIAGAQDTIPLSLVQVTGMEKRILGCYYGSANLLPDLKMMLDLYKKGRIKVMELITKHYSLEEINKGFEDLKSGGNARGVIKY
jgi:S-(hydroxymethyl)glutathione dehydrogenase/alcohol dehydrogenase